MPVLTSKLTVPRHPHALVKRSRLIDQMRGADHNCSVLLTAPAGYGKTTLAAQFLTEQPQNMRAWYTLERHDAEPQIFAMHLAESLARPIARLRRSGLLATSSGEQFDPVKFIDDLGYFLEEYRGPQVWCALDNWETVNDNHQICSMVERLIEYSQVKLRLILTSRVDPALRCRRMQESGRLLTLGEDDLRFSRPELAEAVKLRSDITLDERETEEVYKLTRGWCVSVGFISQSPRRSSSFSERTGVRNLGDMTAMRAYLEEEITRGLGSEMRAFISRCSLLDTISLDSCRIFAESAEIAAARIRQLQDSNLPLVVVGEREFSFHPLFRDVCYELLQAGVERQEFELLHSLATDYYLKHDNLDKAIELQFLIANYDRVLELIHEHWFTLVARSELVAIDKWLTKIPTAKQANTHYLEARTQLLSLQGRFKELEEFLSQHLASAELPAGHPALGTMWLQHRGSLLLTRSGYQYADLRREWREFQRQNGPFDESVLIGAEEILGFAAYAELKCTAAAEHLDAALNLIPDPLHPNALRYRTFRALQDAETGNSDSAREALQEVLADSRHAGVHTTIPVTLIFLIRVLSQAGDFTEALVHLDQLKERSRQARLAYDMIKVHADRYKGLCLFYQGDTALALQYLKESMDHAKSSYLLEFANSARIFEYYSYLLGEPRQILPPVEIDVDRPLSEELLHHHVHAAYRETREGDLNRAHSAIQKLREAVAALGLKPWLVTCNLFAAWIEHKLTLVTEARKSLRQGLRLLQEIGWWSFPMANSEVTAYAVSAAHAWGSGLKQAEILTAIARTRDLESCIRGLLTDETLVAKGKASLIRLAISRNLRGLTSIISMPVSARSPLLQDARREYASKRVAMSLPPLDIRTFGEFATSCEGQKIEYSRPQSRLLMAWLLAAHPSPLHEELICESFWPQISPERARANLRTIISALRKSLDSSFQHPGKSYVVLKAERYSLDLPESSKVDFLEFERLCSKIPNGDKSGLDLAPDNLIRVERALEIYRGAFLTQLQFEEFAFERRERLESRYFRILELYADELLQSGALERAEEAIRTGLRHDPLWEAGVSIAMEVYTRANQTLKAIRTYRQYEAALRSELDLNPGRKLQDQLERLLLS